MNIQIVQVDKQSKTSANGKSYMQLEVAYKNLQTGKLEGKKVMSFSEPIFSIMNGSKQGDVFDITSVKNEKTGYWDWVGATQQAPGTEKVVEAKASPAVSANRGSYETPEERAQRQVFIVKQSSISNSIAVLSVGAKAPPSGDAVIALAQKFTDWVFGKQKLEELPNDLEQDVE